MPDFTYYYLELANGVNWCIAVSTEISQWGNVFASILNLKSGLNKHSRKIFILPPMEKESEISYIQTFFHEDRGIARKNIHTFHNRRMHLYYHPKSHECIGILSDAGKNNYIHNIMAALFCIYLQVIEMGGQILHGALLAHPDLQGNAIIAASGTGKSTCARRIPPPWYAPCDDLFIAIKKENTQYFAHPVPTWSEYLWNQSCNRTWKIEQGFKLSGLFFLQKGERDAVIPCDASEAALKIYSSALQSLEWYMVDLPKRDYSTLSMMIFSNACNMAKNCRTFILEATLQGNFWEEIEKTITNMDVGAPLSGDIRA